MPDWLKRGAPFAGLALVEPSDDPDLQQQGLVGIVGSFVVVFAVVLLVLGMFSAGFLRLVSFLFVSCWPSLLQLHTSVPINGPNIWKHWVLSLSMIDVFLPQKHLNLMLHHNKICNLEM